MDDCRCGRFLAAKMEAVRALARDAHLPRRLPRGDPANYDRLRWVARTYRALMDEAVCPVHGNPVSSRRTLLED